MNRRIVVLGCGWSSYFLKDFIHGMMRAVEGKHIDIYLFNTYNYIEYSGFPNRTGFSIYNLINYDDFDGVVVLADLINNERVLERERRRILKAQKPALTINKKLKGRDAFRTIFFLPMVVAPAAIAMVWKFSPSVEYAYCIWLSSYSPMQRSHILLLTISTGTVTVSLVICS